MTNQTDLVESIVPVNHRHAFRTLFGLPPDTSDLPVCGTVLPDNWSSLRTDPICPGCNREVNKETARLAREAAKVKAEQDRLDREAEAARLLAAAD